MGYEQAFEDTVQYFGSEWNQTPISWPNVSFDPPNPPEPFVKFDMSDGESSRIEASQYGLNRYPGILYIRINIPIGQGTKTWRTYADDLRGIFEWTDVGSVEFRGARIGSVERDKSSSWLEVPVTFPYRFQERAGNP